MKAAFKAHYWHASLSAALVLAIIGFLSRSTLVELPFLQETVPARALVALFSVVASITPLLPAFPSLSSSLVREPALRAMRAPGAVGLATIGYAPAAIVGDDPGAGTDTVLFVVLLVMAITSVVLVGDFAWAIVLGFGFTALFVDTSPAAPVSRALERIDSFHLGLALLLGCVLYAWRGARSPK